MKNKFVVFSLAILSTILSIFLIYNDRECTENRKVSNEFFSLCNNCNLMSISSVAGTTRSSADYQKSIVITREREEFISIQHLLFASISQGKSNVNPLSDQYVISFVGRSEVKVDIIVRMSTVEFAGKQFGFSEHMQLQNIIERMEKKGASLNSPL